MEARADSGERIAFVIERGAGRVLVAGEPVALPPKEFRLLLELADSPGEARPAGDLIEAVWGPNSQMSGNDVYWLVWKLRRRIGDGGREHKILTNRKGHGYLIDPAVAELTVVDVLPGDPPPAAPGLDSPATELGSGAGQAEDERTEFALAGADFGRESGTFDPVAPVAGASNESASSEGTAVDDDPDRGALPLGPPQNLRRSGLRRHLVAAALVLAAAAAGVAARSIATGPTEPPSGDTPRAAVETPQPERRDRREGTRPRDTQPQPDKGTGKPRRPSGRGGPVVAAAPPVATAPSNGSGAEATVEAQPRPHVKRAPKPEQPQLPPPPTRYLYHLYNSENGDHFVTTDGGAVTEHEAKGYEGGAIGRVYVTPEKATKAIALNKGSAFVFADAAPKTEPASATLPLWLAKSEGDFFYTTSESEASQDGWSATFIGYVRTL